MSYEQPTLEEAVAAGVAAQEAVYAAADQLWLDEAEGTIVALAAGTRFIAEDIVRVVNERGFTTRNHKAIGPIVSRLARVGVIRQTGSARKARTSHGALKPEWERT